MATTGAMHFHGVWTASSLAIVMQLSLGIAGASARDYPNTMDWSADKPPSGWSQDAYSPNAQEPNFGDDYKPDSGRGAYQDGSYNSYTDPHHPLKNPEQDPGEEWNRRPGQNMPDNSPGVISGNVAWDWGERYYGQQFTAVLTIYNGCDTPRPVSLKNNGLLWLSFPDKVTVPPGATPVTGQVQLPPEPDPPINLGLPGSPGWGWVEPPNMGIPPPGMFPPPQFHQPNFAKIEGSIVAWHAWAPGSGKDCLPARVTYEASGHIHFRPPAPDGGGGGPSRIAEADVCEVYWKIGEPPPNYKASDRQRCELKMQQLAVRYRRVILAPYIQNSADDWLWLPGEDELANMPIEQLLAFKKRADAIVGGAE